MSATATTAPVVVGVTGKSDNSAALAYAVREAKASKRPLHLLTVVQDVLPVPSPGLMAEPLPWEDIGKGVLAEVEEELTGHDIADLEVHRSVLPGPPNTVLTDASEKAGLIVLQHRSLSRLHRLFTGSTVVAVAANAACPVVSVPHEWTPGDRSRRVVVGVHEDGAPSDLLMAAFDAAAAHGWSVHLVHAWWLDPLYADWAQATTPALVDEVRAAVQQAVAPFAQSHPGVQVEIEVRNEPPADVLRALAEDSDLMVVGRHGSRFPLPHRIGSIARTLVSSAPCPVMVVPV